MAVADGMIAGGAVALTTTGIAVAVGSTFAGCAPSGWTSGSISVGVAVGGSGSVAVGVAVAVLRAVAVLVAVVVASAWRGRRGGHHIGVRREIMINGLQLSP